MKNPDYYNLTINEMLHYINDMLTKFYGAYTVAGSKVRGLQKAELAKLYKVVYLWRHSELSMRIKIYEDTVKELVG